MSRFRQMSESAPYARFARMECTLNGNPFFTDFYHAGLASDSAAGVRYDLRSLSEMTDDFPFNGGRPFRNVQHYKASSAYVQGSSLNWGPKTDSSTGLKYQYTGESFWAMPYSTASLRNSMNSALNSVDWNSYVIALANLVNGNVNTKSLLGVTLREVSSTIRMVRNPFGLLKTDWRHRAGSSSAMDLARKGSNLWLEGIYGWKSAYQDLKSFSKTYDKYASSVLHIQQTKGFERFAKAGTASFAAPAPTVTDSQWEAWRTALDGGSQFGPNYPWARIIFSPGQCRFNLTCRAVDSLTGPTHRLSKWLFALGSTSSQILETIWEATPYSFVVDWFVNSSAILELPRMLESSATLSSLRVNNVGYSAKACIPFTYQILWRQYRNGWYWRGVSTVSKAPPANSFASANGYLSQYNRTVGLPGGTGSLISQRGLSVTQGVSGFALAFQRIFGR